MTISYNWLSEYLPEQIDPERLSRILTSIGLEVESMHPYENIRGGLKGLVVGEVLTCEQHPNADKLKLTTVNTGSGEALKIVCGAPNVAAGQKVVVAPVGTTIYPLSGDPLTMKVAKIRGEESHGMLCAEDELGIGESHEGIIVLPAELQPGQAVATHFKIYTDIIYEIGLTPNRMDAMSHLGVARDVCAYLTHHDKKEFRPHTPFTNSFKNGLSEPEIGVAVINTNACKRYSGVTIKDIRVGESPEWLRNRLKAIGQRPVNNIVDITNYILHETGQPLHAFDLTALKEQKIQVRNLDEGTLFTTLDGKQRKLSAEDLMICNGKGEPMCIAGVFGGAESGVTESTTAIFLESAWFDPIDIRKTSFRHDLRTEAAARFEKNVDISNTVQVLKRAALMITELAGGEIASGIIDEYPQKQEKAQISLKYHYLKRLSGKNYHPDTIKKILQSLGFDIAKEGIDDIRVMVPYSKPDITLPADIVEEIMRIDGFDNIEIPSAITLSPAVESHGHEHRLQEKTANFLAGLGFHEIFTNSITNAAYFEEKELEHGVRLLNNLSAVHNIMRPSMLETGLEVVSYNLNRKNADLRLFEFGKTYRKSAEGEYREPEHLCLYITGNSRPESWKGKAVASDLYYLKGVLNTLLSLWNFRQPVYQAVSESKLNNAMEILVKRVKIAEIGMVSKKDLSRFDIRQQVFYADINWNEVLKLSAKSTLRFTELPRQLPVYRDLAIIVGKQIRYEEVEEVIRQVKLSKLKMVRLFDVFESEKLGSDKKSLAMSFTFLDEQKTLTDKEIDDMMQQLISALEKSLSAEIRK